jgi:inorganic pyrophosphatase
MNSNSTKFIGMNLDVIIDRPIGFRHPDYGFYYPINYGYIPKTISGDGEELDAYILGIKYPLKKFRGLCVAVIKRKSMDDDKLIMVPENYSFSINEIIEETKFQEKWFSIEIITRQEKNDRS